MSRERVTLFDTTLRDGAQTTGVDFSLDDKKQIAALLDALGIDYVEGGYPGANPLDTEFFKSRRTAKARFAAFGMTRRAGRSASNDPGIAALLDSAADSIVFVAKSWDYQVLVALGCSLEENLDGITDSVRAAVASGRETILDCEHFFDGYKANPEYAIQCAAAAYAAGARWIALCDTNGGTLPHEVEEIVRAVSVHVPGDHLAIHAHNDTEQAVANSLAAVRAGARQIHGTLNGLGERCGNANLCSIIPTLMLKPEYSEKYEIGVTEESLRGLTKISHALDELLNRAPNRHAPYVGASAFATKAGIHASAVMKDPRTYEHVTPESVGNSRRVLVSDQAGKSNILAELERLGVPVGREDPRIARLLVAVKDKEAQGYAFEGADASFELLARRVLGHVPDYFEVDRFRVDVERRHNARGELETFSEATVRVNIDGQSLISAAEGNGPVHALYGALCKDLGKYQQYIDDIELLDFKVRIFQGGADAVTRVLIEFGDKDGETWTTVGVSPNLIDASFQALLDAIQYKLLKAGA
ncbi:citramalate synthase [Rhodoblastus acidophilus]|uniref:Citramalate synthase n=1 Tax=Candidatus Rhodoblastus alkanivorans TaxID=2954117 RepID=A0ABS9Z523_9HYPH|nr:citramalate synthase [Candidatus Rhodoblastus alkanivorans]MCI4679876.1 citramalate synthase [Candidatus Rhodoblastus alkanivorans]MCI4682721.1 citramalate synthase [Candidatus Rhodoblastus alkanivorans]MDI4640028.1 citramalate synthase [Rhodoblastus acidophilus]